MMKRIGFILGLIPLGLIAQQTYTNFNQLTQAYYDLKSKQNPIEATFNGNNQYNDKLPNTNTKTYEKEVLSANNIFTKALQQINYEQLNTEEQLSYAIMQWELKIQQEIVKHPLELLPLDQFNGLHLKMAQLGSGDSAQPFKTVQDYENWLKRLDAYYKWLDTAEINMKKGINQKIVLPKILVQKIIPQFSEIIASKTIEENLFYSPINTMPNSFDTPTKQRLTKAYKQSLKKGLIPAYKRMIHFLQTEYLPNAKDESGIGTNEIGKKIYKTLAEQWTTTTTDPMQIHQLGLKEVARIRIEMEKVKQQVGYAGSLTSFFDVIRNKKELKPFTKPQEVLANFEQIHQRMKPQLVKLFSLTPQTSFEVRRTESYREKTASAEYVQGNLATNRPGIFYVPIPDILNYNYYADEDLFLHEAIPGHHYQIAIQQENEKLPDFRRYNWFGAYGEGWALYAESLGKTLGLYEDPYQYFGMLSNDMHRAIRLVVDTGIHLMGWTRTQAIQYSLENEAEPETSIVAEVERYMAFPAQALSYKMGQLKILELCQKAQQELGNQFDIKAFHQEILMSGGMPLALLEKKINNWINKNK